MKARDIVNNEIIEKQQDEQAQREAMLGKEIELGDEYRSLKKHPAWIKLEREIQDRTNTLSRLLLTIDDEKRIYRTQGEILGIYSVLNVVQNAIDTAEEAKRILKGEENGEA